jgi:hypothetical protein
VERYGPDSFRPGPGPAAGRREEDSESAGSINGGEFLDQVRDCSLKEGTAPSSALVGNNCTVRISFSYNGCHLLMDGVNR